MAVRAARLRAYERILTIAPSVQARVQRRARDAEVDIVYSGVDRRFFALASEEGPYLLYFGRMDIHTKGIDLLIAAFAEIAAEHPDIRLKLAGRGTPKQLANVKSLARRAGLEGGWRSSGMWTRNDKASCCAARSMVCVPSRYEGWCMVAVEAAAAGKAVLGTDIDGLRDAVRHDETGVLVPPDDVGALAAGMRALIADDSKRRSLGIAGRAWAGRFSWDRLAEDLEERVWASGGGSPPLGQLEENGHQQVGGGLKPPPTMRNVSEYRKNRRYGEISWSTKTNAPKPKLRQRPRGRPCGTIAFFRWSFSSP